MKLRGYICITVSADEMGVFSYHVTVPTFSTHVKRTAQTERFLHGQCFTGFILVHTFICVALVPLEILFIENNPYSRNAHAHFLQKYIKPLGNRCMCKEWKDLLCLRSTTARSGQLAHITTSIRITITKVPVLTAGGDTINYNN